MPLPRHVVRATAIAALVACAASFARTPGDGPGARTLLESGKAADALAAVRTELELAPESAELLDLASRAAEADGKPDEALWYARLASRGEPPAKEAKKFTDAVTARLASLDPLQSKDRAALDLYTAALFAMGQKAASKKLYISAVELYSRCRATALEEKADAELAKIYANKKAVETLLESGADVPVRTKKKRSAEATARENAKHADWANAYQIKGDNYTVITNMGVDLAEQMSVAMEQMNRYYRTVFHVKERGGDTARVTIRVYKTRAEFDQNEDGEQAPGVKGFFRPGANQVSTYDTRVEGFPPSFLWSTLFHEASHQFTSLIAPGNLIPGWLNEGTASYFEGARLRSNGAVETNLVPELRLAELKGRLGAGTPTLRSVVSYFQPGSYDGSFYPFGWGLVYFLKNYENDACERIYEPLYRDYMLAYKSGATHDPFERFVEYFVTKAKDPEVTDFAAFEKRWKAWMLTLADRYFGPPEKAEQILAIARKQRDKGKLDAAVESYRWALRKRSDDVAAAFELGDVFAAQKVTDAAVASYQRAIDVLRDEKPDASVSLAGETRDRAGAIDLCRARITKLEPVLGDGRRDAEQAFLTAALKAAREYADAKRPLVALDVLDRAREAFGDERGLTDLRTEIASASHADNRLWRRIDQGQDLSQWDVGEGWTKTADSIEAQSDVPTTALSKLDLPDRYGFEADVALDDPKEGTLFGIVFGANANTTQIVVLVANRSVQLAAFEGSSLRPIKPLGRAKADGPLMAKLGIEVANGKVEFFVDGQSVAKRAFAADELAGDVGLIVDGGAALFRNVRVRY